MSASSVNFLSNEYSNLNIVRIKLYTGLSNLKILISYSIQFLVKKDWHERVLVLEIENNITKIIAFLSLWCEFEITIT